MSEQTLPLLKKDDPVLLTEGIFGDYHHIEAGAKGVVRDDQVNDKLLVTFTGHGPTQLVLVGRQHLKLQS